MNDASYVENSEENEIEWFVPFSSLFSFILRPSKTYKISNCTGTTLFLLQIGSVLSCSYCSRMEMSNHTRTDDTEKNDVRGDPLIRTVDFNSLMLPLFTCDEETESSSSSHAMEKLTPSAPILMSETRATNLTASTISAAFVATAKTSNTRTKLTGHRELRTKPHCRKCPFPSCAINKIGFHNINSSMPLRHHMDDFHPSRTDHNGPFFCPVRTCEYAVLGFQTLGMCMKHLCMHHSKLPLRFTISLLNSLT
jgi:hypothetical protein